MLANKLGDARVVEVIIVRDCLGTKKSRTKHRTEIVRDALSTSQGVDRAAGVLAGLLHRQNLTGNNDSGAHGCLVGSQAGWRAPRLAGWLSQDHPKATKIHEKTVKINENHPLVQLWAPAQLPRSPKSTENTTKNNENQ